MKKNIVRSFLKTAAISKEDRELKGELQDILNIKDPRKKLKEMNKIEDSEGTPLKPLRGKEKQEFVQEQLKELTSGYDKVKNYGKMVIGIIGTIAQLSHMILDFIKIWKKESSIFIKILTSGGSVLFHMAFIAQNILMITNSLSTITDYKVNPGELDLVEKAKSAIVKQVFGGNKILADDVVDYMNIAISLGGTAYSIISNASILNNIMEKNDQVIEEILEDSTII